jgi:hypothetical protein
VLRLCELQRLRNICTDRAQHARNFAPNKVDRGPDAGRQIAV